MEFNKTKKTYSLVTGTLLEEEKIFSLFRKIFNKKVTLFSKSPGNINYLIEDSRFGYDFSYLIGVHYYYEEPNTILFIELTVNDNIITKDAKYLRNKYIGYMELLNTLINNLNGLLWVENLEDKDDIQYKICYKEDCIEYKIIDYLLPHIKNPIKTINMMKILLQDKDKLFKILDNFKSTEMEKEK